MPRNNHNKPRRVTSGDSMAEVAATRHGYRKNELVFYDSGKAKRTCLGWCCYYGSCPHWYKVGAALRWYMRNAATQPPRAVFSAQNASGGVGKARVLQPRNHRHLLSPLSRRCSCSRSIADTAGA